MNLLTCSYNPRDDRYIVFHSALLVFTLTVVIPMNYHITRLPSYWAFGLFALGFFSLFMITRNEKVGSGLLKAFGLSGKMMAATLQEALIIPDRKEKVALDESLSHADVPLENEQAPILLLRNIIQELTNTHRKNLDKATLDTFERLNAKLCRIQQ